MKPHNRWQSSYDDWKCRSPEDEYDYDADRDEQEAQEEWDERRFDQETGR